jgi:integrase
MASIKRRPNGTFLVVWRDGGRASQQRSRSFRDEADALAFKKEKDAERGLGPFRTARERDAAHAKFWNEATPSALEDEWSVVEYTRRMIDAQDLRSTTRNLYLRNLRLHVENTDLGRADVRFVTPEEVTRWWTDLKKRAGVGARRNVQQLVSKAFNRAVLVGDREDNPMRRAPEVKRPTPGRQEEVEPLTYGQVEDLAEAARARRRGQIGPVAEMSRQRERLEVLVMAVGGLRAGEVGGLRRQDMARQGDRCQLRLRQQVVRETGRPAYVSALKTEAARRTVTIPCWLWDEVEGFVRTFAPAPDGRIFHGPNGEPRAHNDINHAVQAAGKRIGMDVNAHQLRHTAVSLLIDRGANPRAIQRFVGHSDIKMTLGTYGHLFDEGGAALADIMAELHEKHLGNGDGDGR